MVTTTKKTPETNTHRLETSFYSHKRDNQFFLTLQERLLKDLDICRIKMFQLSQRREYYRDNYDEQLFFETLKTYFSYFTDTQPLQVIIPIDFFEYLFIQDLAFMHRRGNKDLNNYKILGGFAINSCVFFLQTHNNMREYACKIYPELDKRFSNIFLSFEQERLKEAINESKQQSESQLEKIKTIYRNLTQDTKAKKAELTRVKQEQEAKIAEIEAIDKQFQSIKINEEE